jgi:hypothetical protein
MTGSISVITYPNKLGGMLAYYFHLWKTYNSVTGNRPYSTLYILADKPIIKFD